jgi:hypothetical protein
LVDIKNQVARKRQRSADFGVFEALVAHYFVSEMHPIQDEGHSDQCHRHLIGRFRDVAN